jgi:hypothetical protein
LHGVLRSGFTKRSAEAQRQGFDWIVPKDHITMKAALIPDELNIDVTRFLRPRAR